MALQPVLPVMRNRETTRMSSVGNESQKKEGGKTERDVVSREGEGGGGGGCVCVCVCTVVEREKKEEHRTIKKRRVA